LPGDVAEPPPVAARAKPASTPAEPPTDREPVDNAFNPQTYGPASILMIDASAQGAALQQAVATLVPPLMAGQAYFGAVAIGDTGEQTGWVQGYAGLADAEAAALARCQLVATGCVIVARLIPEGFDGRMTGTLSHAQARIWRDYRDRALPPMAFMRMQRAFAWSRDGAAGVAEMSSTDAVTHMALLRCDLNRRRDVQMFQIGGGCVIGAVRDR